LVSIGCSFGFESFSLLESFLFAFVPAFFSAFVLTFFVSSPAVGLFGLDELVFD